MQRASCWPDCHTQAPAALHRGLRAGGSPYFHIDKFRALEAGTPPRASGDGLPMPDSRALLWDSHNHTDLRHRETFTDIRKPGQRKDVKLSERVLLKSAFITHLK